MKQVLFIRPGTHEDDKILWCESGSQQVGTLAGWGELNTLADHPWASNICLLLPASEMIFRHFSLPKKGASAQGTVFSWMAEETLIGDVDGLHWTVVNKKGREVDAMAIHADVLRRWLTLFSEAGLGVTQALPDAMLLPVSDGGTTLVALEESYWLRFSPFSACEADAGLLPLLMSKCGEGEVRCYGDAPEGVRVDEALAWQHPLVLIQPQWEACRINLLHGEFSLRSAQGPRFKHTKALMTAVVLLGIGLLLGPRLGAAWMLSQQQEQVASEMLEVAQHYFPTLRQTTNLKYHVGQSLSKVQKGFFIQLDALEQIRQSQPAVEVSEVEYDDTQGQLTLNVKSMDAQAIQTFVNQANEHFALTLQPISSEAPYTAIVTGKFK
ncbi:type II secretion system protein GspL [Scandinavium sp. NPDC088450]|uniref:type II secretion system protein GspL n=1 Tax=Scandinavium sp. NPDC088450 TaxID=3364514 RepID=UPI00384AC34D